MAYLGLITFCLEEISFRQRNGMQDYFLCFLKVSDRLRGQRELKAHCRNVVCGICLCVWLKDIAPDFISPQKFWFLSSWS